MKTIGGESGQTLVMVAVSMTVLLGFMAFATDVGVLLHSRRNAQIAADAAALAAAGELNYGTAGTDGAGQTAAAQNGFTNGSNGATVTINTNGNVTNATFASAGHAQAIVSQSTPTFFLNTFMHLFNSSSTFKGMTVTASAIAENGLPSKEKCIDTLSSNGAGNTNDPGADVYFNGAAVISSPKCSINDDSNAGNSLAFDGSYVVTAQAINTVGGYQHTGASIFTINGVSGASPTTGTASFSDPLNYLDADEPSIPSGCATSAPVVYNGGIKTLSPGCYSGLTITGAAILTLTPGLYIIDGSTGLNISGAAVISQGAAVSGGATGVEFYLTNGAGVTLGTGAFTLNLSAPTATNTALGLQNGVLFFEDPNDSAPFNFSGAAVMNLNGIIYLPSANVNLKGSDVGNLYADFVCSTFSNTGSSVVNDYAQVNANNPLTHMGIALVD